MTDKKCEWIVDATDESFEKEVIERSKETLCIVDFWAEWCGPCRMLGPILEELAEESKGEFTLVKVDADSAPMASQNYGVASIPTVFAFSGGEALDGFAGVMPKEQIKEWIESQLTADEINAAIELVDSDPENALVKLKEYYEAQPEEPAIRIALAEAYMKLSRDEEAKEIILDMEDRGFLEPEAEKIKARLELKSKESLDVDSLKANAESDPDNLELQLEYASALFGHNQFEDGFIICLEVIGKDKTGAGDKARELMVEVFRSLPDDSDLTSEYRRKLSMALY